jgi:hypothetical protein
MTPVLYETAAIVTFLRRRYRPLLVRGRVKPRAIGTPTIRPHAVRMPLAMANRR